MHTPLDQLLQGCLRHDPAMQKELYSQYFPLFMNMCLRYTQSQEEAEEALNNAYLRIFKNINQYQGQGSFEGWMKKIVVNCCITYISRAQYRQHHKVISIDQYYGAAADSGSYSLLHASNPVQEKYQQQYLLQLLKNLPTTTRLVFNLYVFEDYSHKEIGELLDMAERTSQAHLAKARKQLADELDKKKLMLKMQRV